MEVACVNLNTCAEDCGVADLLCGLALGDFEVAESLNEGPRRCHLRRCRDVGALEDLRPQPPLDGSWIERTSLRKARPMTIVSA